MRHHSVARSCAPLLAILLLVGCTASCAESVPDAAGAGSVITADSSGAVSGPGLGAYSLAAPAGTFSAGQALRFAAASRIPSLGPGVLVARPVKVTTRGEPRRQVTISVRPSARVD